MSVETTAAFTVKPIGHMKSVFHFKNGTPRQSSLCQNARGILGIDKSVFNNPEHSLDGLQHYSHAWILFVFHKNNNAHKKAKVKPPRLDGQRVGVFSTRSPYRPNNIGLSLAKIDKVEGASIHFSGIDILDGTPIIDIKPYIPQYDRPTPIQESPLPTANDVMNESKSVCDPVAYPLTPKTNILPNDFPNKGRDRGWNNSSTDTRSNASSTNTNTPIYSSQQDGRSSLEKGFYSLSSEALDKAGETLKREGVKNSNALLGDHGDGDYRQSFTKSDNITDPLRDVDSSQAEHNNVMNVGNKANESNEDGSDNDDDFLDSLVGNVICKAATDVLLTDDTSITGADNPGLAFGGGIQTTRLSSSTTKGSVDDCDYDNPSAPTESYDNNSRETTDMKNCDGGDNSAVTAPWLSSPPVSKVRVVFSAESLDQLESFHSTATDHRYKTEMLSGPEDAKKAITSVLHEEPRSVYRRQKCQNSVYFFAIDVLHVTCWFDGDVVTVLRIRPAADVPQLQGK